MSDEKPFDKAVDDKYMRLCTPQRFTQHMGNVLDEKLIALANKYKLSVTGERKPARSVRGGRSAAAVAKPSPIINI
jgi:hypothetical protein